MGTRPRAPLLARGRPFSSDLKWELFVTSGIPTVTPNPPPGETRRFFSPISSTLIYGQRDAVLVDTFMTVDQNDVLVDWVKTSGKNVTTIYISTGATSEAARPKLVANVRSNRSSSGVATRCVSCGSRPPMRRQSWRMTPMPGSIVLIPKDLSVVRRDEMRRVDALGSSSLGEIVRGRLVTFTRVINQAEMNAKRGLTMEVEVRPHSLVRVHVHAIHEPSRLVRTNGQQTGSWGAVLLVAGAPRTAMRRPLSRTCRGSAAKRPSGVVCCRRP